MADNTQLNPGAGGPVIATDEIGGIHHQRVKLEFGAEGSVADVSASNPVPVVANTTPAVAADSTRGPKRVAVTNSGDTAVVGAPGSGLSIYVTGVWLSNRGGSAITCELKDGSTARFGGLLPLNGGGVAQEFSPPWKLTANTALNANLSGAGDVYVNVHYYVAA